MLRASRPPQPLPVTVWAQAYSLIPDPSGRLHSASLLGPGPGFDREYAMTTDLAQPVIIATVPAPARSPALLLIDGTHRLYKATRLGRRHLGYEPGLDWVCVVGLVNLSRAMCWHGNTVWPTR